MAYLGRGSQSNFGYPLPFNAQRSQYRAFPYQVPQYPTAPNQPSSKRKREELAEEAFALRFPRPGKQALTVAPRKAYNIYSRVTSSEPSYEPYIHIPGLQDIISGYSGGACDAITESARRCWTKNREISSENRLYNCRSYCFQQANAWLLPIIVNHPTRFTFELTMADNESPESYTINVTQLNSWIPFKIEIRGLGHPAIDRITITYSTTFTDNQWVYSRLSMDFYAPENEVDRQEEFHRRANEWISQFRSLFRDGYTVGQANSDVIFLFPNNEMDTRVTRDQFVAQMSAFFTTILQHILSDSTGPTTLAFNADLGSYFTLGISGIPYFLNYANLRVSTPDFFDDQAVWTMKFPMKYDNIDLETQATFVNE